MGNYNFKQVKAFALIGFHNWNHSANRKNRDLENFEMFIEPLEKIYTKEKAIVFSKKLVENEKEVKNKKAINEDI